MEEVTTREKVLTKIRNALMSKNENPYQDVDFDAKIFNESDEAMDVTFAQEFTNADGKFIYCENLDEFVSTLKLLVNENKWKNVFCFDNAIQTYLKAGGIEYRAEPEELYEAKVGITRCEFLIASHGSIMVSSRQVGRKINIFPDIHIVLALASQLVPDLKDGLKNIRKKYEDGIPSLISVITGPSRTSDIEKTLVMGAHGPRELYVFFIDDSE